MEGFTDAIYAIECETGKKPSRIEMPDGAHKVKWHGVDLYVSASMAGYIMMSCGPLISNQDMETRDSDMRAQVEKVELKGEE